MLFDVRRFFPCFYTVIITMISDYRIASYQAEGRLSGLSQIPPSDGTFCAARQIAEGWSLDAQAMKTECA